MKNTHGGALILVKLQASKINTPPWVFFTFFKLYKWYQIAQRITFGTPKALYKTAEVKNLLSIDNAINTEFNLMIHDSRRGFEFSRLNSLSSRAFSRQDKKIKANGTINGSMTFK